MNAIDTNVLAYAFDPADPGKQAKARQLLSELVGDPAESVLLWQVIVEFLAFLRKAEGQGRLTAEDVKARFQEALQLFTLKFPTSEVLHRGFALYERYSLSHWDSLLVAACQDAGVTRLYSEDMQHGADYDGVEIINPFV
ncbi:MAG: PIN domain-containing protein [Pirellulales bacterium]